MPTVKRTSYNRNAKTKTKTVKKTSSISVPASVTVDRDSRVDVEQIENGFLVRESGTIGKGKNQTYYEKKYFTPENPVKISKPAMSFSGKKK
jgi:hypothetical protein